MKLTIPLIIALFFLASFLWYLLAAFTGWQLDPGKWEQVSRILFIIIEFILIVLTGVLISFHITKD